MFILLLTLARRTAWAGLDADTKHVNLAAATRRLDSLPWVGRKADDAQSAEWPRLDLTPAAPGLPREVEQADHTAGRGFGGEPCGSVRRAIRRRRAERAHRAVFHNLLLPAAAVGGFAGIGRQ